MSKRVPVVIIESTRHWGEASMRHPDNMDTGNFLLMEITRVFNFNDNAVLIDAQELAELERRANQGNKQ